MTNDRQNTSLTVKRSCRFLSGSAVLVSAAARQSNGRFNRDLMRFDEIGRD